MSSPPHTLVGELRQFDIDRRTGHVRVPDRSEYVEIVTLYDDVARRLVARFGMPTTMRGQFVDHANNVFDVWEVEIV